MSSFDSPTVVVATDSSWLYSESDTTHLGKWTNSDFGGDRVDASKSIPGNGWAMPRFDSRASAAWKNASVYAGVKDKLQLSADEIEPNQKRETIGAKTITHLPNKRVLVEMVGLYTGWVEIRNIKAPPGTVVSIKVSAINVSESTGMAQAQYNMADEYVVGSSGEGSFCNRFR